MTGDTHSVWVYYTLDDSDDARLAEECTQQCGVTRSHLVRCAIMKVGVDDLDRAPLDVRHAPHVAGTQSDTDHADSRKRNRSGVRLTRAEYEVLCRSAIRSGISRSERVRSQIGTMLDEEHEHVLELATTMNPLLLDQYAHLMLKQLAM